MAKRSHNRHVPSERVKRGRSDAPRRERQAERLARLLRLLELLNDLHRYSLNELAQNLNCGGGAGYGEVRQLTRRMRDQVRQCAEQLSVG